MSSDTKWLLLLTRVPMEVSEGHGQKVSSTATKEIPRTLHRLVHASFIVLLVALFLEATSTISWAQTSSSQAPVTVADTAPGWLWNDMFACDADTSSVGSAHAGGPGSSSTYIFSGTGVAVYGLPALTVKVGNSVHRNGKLRIIVDGLNKGDFPGRLPGQPADAAIGIIHDLPAGNHSLLLEPVDGWAAVSKLVITNVPKVQAVNSNGSEAGRLVVPNFCFEVPDLFGNYAYSPTGAAWNFSVRNGNSGAGITDNDTAWRNPAAPSGKQVAFVQSTGAMWQTLSGFGAGIKYLIVISAAQRSLLADGGSQTVQVWVDQTIKGYITPIDGNYADYTVGPFTVTAGTHAIAFVGTNVKDSSVFIDNVRIVSKLERTAQSVCASHMVYRCFNFS